MRGHDPLREQAFFELFAAYFDLERDTGRSYTGGEYSLDRMLPLADVAGNPQHHLSVIHVAGTKGKGSTCHFVAALIVSAGRTCGLFASPHLVTVRERFQVNGNLVEYEQLLDHARRLETHLRQFRLKPSLFEILTVLGLRLFAENECEFAIMETGIGGRLDATNFIPNPVCCGITPISFDHTQLLGDTIAAIASEKAGIIKSGVPVALSRQPFSDADSVIRNRAVELGAPILAPVSDARVVPFLGALNPPSFLRENLALAISIVEGAGITPVPERFQYPELRARCEVIRTDPLVVLDAAHNADSARRLVEALSERWPPTRWTVVLGVIKGKDTAGIVRELSHLDAAFILTNPHSHKESDLDTLTHCMGQAGGDVTVIPDLSRAEQLPASGPLLFTGSFFTALIGEELFAAVSSR